MLTQSRLKEVLHYCPETGIFTHLRATRNKLVKIGNVAGCPNAHGHLVVAIDKSRYYLHRLAWLYVYGKFPSLDIDHINCIRTDNRIANLREATKLMNVQNTIKPPKTNTTGYMGVYFDKAKHKFCAQIRHNNKRKFLGYFANPLDAENAYIHAKKTLHIGCTI